MASACIVSSLVAPYCQLPRRSHHISSLSHLTASCGTSHTMCSRQCRSEASRSENLMVVTYHYHIHYEYMSMRRLSKFVIRHRPPPTPTLGDMETWRHIQSVGAVCAVSQDDQKLKLTHDLRQLQSQHPLSLPAKFPGNNV